MAESAASELDRVRVVYRQRDRAMHLGMQTPAELVLAGFRDQAFLCALLRHGSPVHKLRVLDVGCGVGARLRDFQRLGVQAANLAGVEQSAERVAICLRESPAFDVVQGQATQIPFPAASFDIVVNATMLSSILDNEVAARIAAEMRRVVRPDGLILSYDLAVGNPRNPDVRAVTLQDLAHWFPGMDRRARSLGLPGAMVRRLKLGAGLTRCLHAVPLLRSHWFVELTRKSRV